MVESLKARERCRAICQQAGAALINAFQDVLIAEGCYQQLPLFVPLKLGLLCGNVDDWVEIPGG